MNCESAFNFFSTINKQNGGKTQPITREVFGNGVKSLTNDKFKAQEINCLWSMITSESDKSVIDRYLFRTHFEALNYSGLATVKSVTGTKAASSNNSRSTIKTRTSSQMKLDSDIIEKLRSIVHSSSRTLEETFQEFDKDKNGFISAEEFRNAVRRNIGLTQH